MPLLLALLLCLEGIIYLWAVWTVEDPDFIFEKCTRNSGRVSAALNLMILVMVGYYGLKKMYAHERLKNTFWKLMTLFAVNHIIHFFYIFKNFKSKEVELVLSENKHGIITFVFILLFPIILWSYKKLNKILYIAIILHLFNATSFMIKTFYGKIKPEKPAYLHQIGIGIMCAVLVYILYRVLRENKKDARLN
ncbi:MAG: hypothetical protein GQ574_03430 [Crocinitomix sp.]|nr:hypothetical protein [Crocinitomix sp.]